jgi:hypothetical protein
MAVEFWVLAALAGSIGQLIDSAAGMGFGAFSSTVMIAGGVTPAIVVATVNLAKIGSGLSSGLAHWRVGNVRWAWVMPLVISGIVGGVLGAMLITHIPREVTRLFVPFVLLAMGLLLLRRFLSVSFDVPRVAGASQEWAPPAPTSPWQKVAHEWANASSGIQLGVIGFFGGIFNGISGAYGPFTTSSVLLAKGGHPRFAVGTVNFVEFFVASAIAGTLLFQITWAEFQWRLPVALIIGSLLTAPLGAYLSRRLPARSVGILVGLTLVGLNVWSILRVIT